MTKALYTTVNYLSFIEINELAESIAWILEEDNYKILKNGVVSSKVQEIFTVIKPHIHTYATAAQQIIEKYGMVVIPGTSMFQWKNTITDPNNPGYQENQTAAKEVIENFKKESEALDARHPEMQLPLLDEGDFDINISGKPFHPRVSLGFKHLLKPVQDAPVAAVNAT